jgi:hypothetical protein
MDPLAGVTQVGRAPRGLRWICATYYGKICGMATIEELMKGAVDARRVAQNAIALAVREARAADWSWDRISAALGGTPNGETLRRNFGGEKDGAS